MPEHYLLYLFDNKLLFFVQLRKMLCSGFIILFVFYLCIADDQREYVNFEWDLCIFLRVIMRNVPRMYENNAFWVMTTKKPMYDNTFKHWNDHCLADQYLIMYVKCVCFFFWFGRNASIYHHKKKKKNWTICKIYYIWSITIDKTTKNFLNSICKTFLLHNKNNSKRNIYWPKCLIRFVCGMSDIQIFKIKEGKETTELTFTHILFQVNLILIKNMQSIWKWMYIKESLDLKCFVKQIKGSDAF